MEASRTERAPPGLGGGIVGGYYGYNGANLVGNAIEEE